MTTVAWDGKMMAADSATVAGTVKFSTATKLYEVDGFLLGLAGPRDSAQAFLAWFTCGRREADFPVSQRGDNWADNIIITPTGQLIRYEQTPFCMEYPNQIMAVGSGAQLALGAMAAGKNAEQAVFIACQYDIYSDGPVHLIHGHYVA